LGDVIMVLLAVKDENGGQIYGTVERNDTAG